MRTQKLIIEFDGIEYEVEILEGDTETLEVRVNGIAHIVKLKELSHPLAGHRSAGSTPQPKISRASQPNANLTQAEAIRSNQVSAPMPGDIIEISVKPGDQVEVGQELIILEAMKMKNVIRSPQVGTVSAVEVVVGQSVKYGDLLIRFG